jgi:hypothetical protein
MRAKNICFYLLAIVLGGCLPLSIHPLYTDDELVFDEKLLGKWVDDKEIWQFTQDGEKSYKLRVVDGGKEGYFSAHLVQLENMLFLDIFPDGKTLEDVQTFYAIHLFPMHTFIKVEQTEPNLVLRMMDVDKVYEVLKNDPNLLKHEVREDDEGDNAIILTAATQDLQKFVVEYANTEGVFANTEELSRHQPLYTNENVIFDEHLSGEWQSENGDILNSIRTGEKSYDIIFLGAGSSDTGNTELRFTANLVKLNGSMLLAVFFGSHCLEKADPCSLNLIPDYFVLVEQIEPKLLLRGVDYEDVAGMLNDAASFQIEGEADKYVEYVGIRTAP